MTRIQKLIASAISASTILASSGLPVFATTTIEIIGNGAGSDNFGTVNQTTTTTVQQNNNANVVNNISSKSNSGDNSASFNTGGTTAIGTGAATSTVDVENNLNSNFADVDCCNAGDTEVLIGENGALSTNTVALNQANVVAVGQNNNANVVNDVYSKANSGDNSAFANTGGDTLISTGPALTDVDVTTNANSNVAHVGNGLGSVVNPELSLKIIGNGAFSDNFINANLTKVTTVGQTNSANVVNEVKAKANSGDNWSKFNTGGDVLTVTGPAGASVDIENNLNFNHADIDCGCAWDVTAKIAGNGADLPFYGFGEYGYGEEWIYPYPYPSLGDNVINLGLTSAQAYGQDNLANLVNDAGWVKANSGYNNNDLNTGNPGSDPLVSTGASWTAVNVDNNANVNSIGDFPIFDLPWTHVETNFDMSAVMAFFGLLLG